jgi:hypothetical protein
MPRFIRPRRRSATSPLRYIAVGEISLHDATVRAFLQDAIYYSMKLSKMQELFEKYRVKEYKKNRKEYYIYCET